MAVKPLKSPCVDICVLDLNGECKGCRRTTQEIASWRSYNDAERDAVLAQLPARKLAAQARDNARETAASNS